jgi:molybdenum cofactor cytidylyltransferase
MHMNSRRFAAVILAAGYSYRMGRFKSLLPLDGQTTIERVISAFKSNGVDDIIVVIGYQAGAMLSALKPLGVHAVLNRNFRQGMFSSVITGIKYVNRSCRAFFVQPVDIPLVRSATIGALIKKFMETQEKICYPVFMGQRGHPPLIPMGLADEILAWQGHMGLQGFLQTRDAACVDVAVPDEGILLDMDIPQDYKVLLSKIEKGCIPTDQECRMMMAIQGLPKDVIRHCLTVAAVSRAVADALFTAGVRVDTRLVHAAAMVHDIAIKEKSHAVAGANMLVQWGFPKVADIVRAHMDIDVNEYDPVSEAEIVYLADKYIVGHRLADLEERFERKLKKYGQNPVAVEAIRGRKETALRIKTKIEKHTICSMDDIMKAIDPIREDSL